MTTLKKTSLLLINTILPFVFISFVPMLVFGEEVNKAQIKHHVLLTPFSVSLPTGYWLLARKGNTACAIRFTDFKAVRSAGYASFSEPTSNSENNIHGDGRIYAEYDFFSQTDGSGDFKKNNASLGHNKVTRADGNGESSGDLTGCGSLILQIGSFGIGVAFNLFEPLGESVELAPTKWRDVSEINISDPKIKWYHYDKARHDIKISIEDLW
jgi:hypothetical protein